MTRRDEGEQEKKIRDKGSKECVAAEDGARDVDQKIMVRRSFDRRNKPSTKTTMTGGKRKKKKRYAGAGLLIGDPSLGKMGDVGIWRGVVTRLGAGKDRCEKRSLTVCYLQPNALFDTD